MRKPRPWCSVIIPTLNEADHLPATLAALGRGWPEIIVSDGGSTDDTLEVARARGAVIVEGPAGRARQLNAGAAVATGDFLYFLHADTLAPPNLLSHLRAAAHQNVPACCRLRFAGRAENTWLRLFGALSRWNVAAFRFGDQSLFVSRQDFAAVGGYRPDHQLLEGNDIVRRLRRYREDFRVLDATISTSARRYEQYGVVFTQAVYVLIYALYRLRVPQRQLVRLYRTAFAAGT